jgi:hypothetical protein
MGADFKEFIDAERQAIEVAKWIQGEKIQSDPGKPFAAQWIQQHAKNFKEAWDKSCCKLCKKKCKHNNIIDCNNFEQS